MTTIDETEAYEVVAAYLERLGVEGLRQPHDPERVNKAAVIRCLLAEKLQEALDNPPPSGDVRRTGPEHRKSKPATITETPAIRRAGKGSKQ
jgi:hypothetical protein